MQTEKNIIKYPSVDKPWLKYYSEQDKNAIAPKCTIYDFLWENNREHLSEYAYNYFDKKITYKELFDNIDKVAKSFKKIGVKKNTIVGILAVTIPETIYTIYALNKLGAISNMIDPRTSEEGIKSYINETGCKHLFVIDSLFLKIENIVAESSIENVIVCSPVQSLNPVKRFLFNLKNKNNITTNKVIEWENFIAIGCDVNVTISCMSPEDCCIIVHTGGTTGSPKSVMLSNTNLNMAAFQPMHSPLLMKRKDKFFNIMPPFIAYGIVLGIHTAACMGWYSYLFPKFDPKEFAALIKKYKPQGIMGVPTHYEKLMNDSMCDTLDLSFLKVALAGGDKTSVAFENKVNAFFEEHNCFIHLSKGYSMTEASASATISYENANKTGSNGIPGLKTNMAVFDNDGKECSYNELGELCISTPTMMLGYYNNNVETEKIIIKHKDGTKWIHTGDIGYIDEDGFVFVEGRLKRIIIRYDGFKIFPTQIENVCLSETNIIDCCAVGVNDNSHSQGKLPIVFAVLKDNCDIKGVKEKICECCKKELPEYMQPIDFIFIDKMPLTPIGKVDYHTLEKEAEKLLN